LRFAIVAGIEPARGGCTLGGVTQFVGVAELVGLVVFASSAGSLQALWPSRLPVRGAAAEIGDSVLQITRHIARGQQRLLPERPL
jgi:hypothetical protein